jgi:sec-independent protein translocase protein TatC
MTSSQDVDTINSPDLNPEGSREPAINPLDELPGEVEMSIFDHLEELRQRIFYSLIVVVVGIVGCFIGVKPLVQLLEVPAHGVKFLQLAPGEFFFVSMKVAAYGGLILTTPFILYQIIQFVLPGLTVRERRLVIPVVLGSSVLFILPSSLLLCNSSLTMVLMLWSNFGQLTSILNLCCYYYSLQD